MARPRARWRGHHRPSCPRGDDRHPRTGLHPDRPCEGTLALRASSESTPSRTRSSPAVTVVGISFGYLLGGTVIIEQIFSLPGIGNYVLTAIACKDLPIIQGDGPLTALSFVMINLLVDIPHSGYQPEGPIGMSLTSSARQRGSVRDEVASPAVHPRRSPNGPRDLAEHLLATIPRSASLSRPPVSPPP